MEEEYEYESKNDSDTNDGGDIERAKSHVSIAETMSLPREAAFIAVISMAQFMTQFALGTCLSTLHVIGDHFGLSNPGDLSWLIAGYSLTVGTFILMGGRLGDLFGHKKLIIIGYLWFSVWTMVAGLAFYSNHVLFIFARVFQGMGPAVLLPCGLAMLGITYSPGARKDMVFAIFGATAPTGCILGCTFAALFNLAWWPWVFFAQAIALFLLAIAGYFVIPYEPVHGKQSEGLMQKVHDMDIFGGLLGVAALILFNFAWNQAAVVGWQEPYVYVCLILGILIFPVFLWYEKSIAKAPLLPFDTLNSEVAFVLGCVACGWASFGIFIYYIWQFIEELRGVSPLLGCAWLAPLVPSGITAAISTGLLINRVGPSIAMCIALLAYLIGNILLATAPVGQIYWGQLFVCCLIMPWGMDISFPAGTLILSNAVKKEHQGIGASLVNTVVNYSISIGLGLAGTVEGQVNNGGTTQHDLLIGYRGALYMAIGLAGLGLCTSVMFAIKHHPRKSAA